MAALPSVMTAIEIAAPGGPEQLRSTHRPLPAVGPDQVLIRVAAAGVNRPDVMQRQGRYPPPAGASDIPGLEVAGDVVALGSDVTSLQVGSQVTALLPGGGYAEYAAASAVLCLPVPSNLTMVEAAAIPETFFTVWANLFERGHCKSGDVVLVHGGTSGIGTAAIQLAGALGARVYATAGSFEKARACERLGAIRGIDYRQEDFVDVMHAVTDGRGADVILDLIGGDYLARNLEATAVDGRVCIISLLGGARAEINLGLMLSKRLTITASTLRARTVAQKAALADAIHLHVWPFLIAGRVRPVIHQTFPLDKASAAHSLMETSSHIGKIVLTVT